MTELEKMWTELDKHLPIAERLGYGEAWGRMCEDKNADAADAAAWAADATWAADDAAYAAAAYAADAVYAAAAVYAADAAKVNECAKKAIWYITKANEKGIRDE